MDRHFRGVCTYDTEIQDICLQAGKYTAKRGRKARFNRVLQVKPWIHEVDPSMCTHHVALITITCVVSHCIAMLSMPGVCPTTFDATNDPHSFDCVKET